MRGSSLYNKSIELEILDKLEQVKKIPKLVTKINPKIQPSAPKQKTTKNKIIHPTKLVRSARGAWCETSAAPWTLGSIIDIHTVDH